MNYYLSMYRSTIAKVGQFRLFVIHDAKNRIIGTRDISRKSISLTLVREAIILILILILIDKELKNARGYISKMQVGTVLCYRARTAVVPAVLGRVRLLDGFF